MLIFIHRRMGYDSLETLLWIVFPEDQNQRTAHTFASDQTFIYIYYTKRVYLFNLFWLWLIYGIIWHLVTNWNWNVFLSLCIFFIYFSMLLKSIQIRVTRVFVYFKMMAMSIETYLNSMRRNINWWNVLSCNELNEKFFKTKKEVIKWIEI